MPLNIQMPVNNRQHISILLATRGRPDYLNDLLESLEDTTENKRLVDVWTFVDDDDLPTREFLARCAEKRGGVKVTTVVGERTTTNGEMYNTLRQRCTANPGIYMYAGDKILFVTKGWDRIVREAFDIYPDRILFAFATDTHHGDELGAYGFLSAEWANTLGRIFSEYFPFWYDDTWINHVAMMIQRRVKLDVQLGLQAGKGATWRMSNLLFWERFYDNVIDERIRDAEMLRKAAYGADTEACDTSAREGNQLAERLTRQHRAKGSEDALSYEGLYSASQDAKRARGKTTPAHAAAEKRAVDHLLHKLGQSVKRGQFGSALRILDNVMFAWPATKRIQYCRVICQIRARAACHLLGRACCALAKPASYPRYAKRIVKRGVGLLARK